jgi:hypothetical protein
MKVVPPSSCIGDLLVLRVDQMRSVVSLPVPDHVLLHLDDDVIDALWFTLELIVVDLRAGVSDD